MTRKKKALYALAMLVLLGCGLIMFIIAADEQSVISSGLPAADRIRLQDLITQGSGRRFQFPVACDWRLNHANRVFAHRGHTALE